MVSSYTKPFMKEDEINEFNLPKIVRLFLFKYRFSPKKKSSNILLLKILQKQKG